MRRTLSDESEQGDAAVAPSSAAGAFEQRRDGEARIVIEPAFSPRALEPSISRILARAEQKVGLAGERLLSEGLHRVLEEGGSAALSTFSQTLLPHLQELVALLPRLLHDEAEPEEMEAVRRLGVALQEQGVSLQDIIAQGVSLHDRLLQEVAAHLRENDRALVTAVSQLSRTLLQVGQDALLAYHDSATARLVELARSDSLTGLANRHYFEERFEQELLRAQRMMRPLALILIDVDELKPVNDTFGHSVGDQLLRNIATVLRAQTRGIDLAARIGGDEFVLLLAETDRAGATALLDRLVQGVADYRINERSPRFSAGIAVYPEDGRTVVQLMEFADGMLYRAKRDAQA